jgi:transcriptional regulator with XRE-family HTH domain
MTSFFPAYQKAVGRNISGARGQQQIPQTEVARRMQMLGFRKWHQQTVASIERGRRRLTVEEALALAIALKTTIPRLLSPLDDIAVEFHGMDINAESIGEIVAGTRAGGWPFGGES